MRILKIILGILLILCLIYVIISLFLPGERTVSRSITIDGSKAAAYGQVVDFRNWENWSPWLENDSTMVFNYGESSYGEGATYSWTSENSGNGKQSITSVKTNEEIKTLIQFDGMDPVEGEWKFENLDQSRISVTWSFFPKFSFFKRVFGIFVEGQVGQSFETGLSNLKYVVESSKVEEVSLPVKKATLDSMTFYSIRESVNMTEINSEFFATRYAEILDYLGNEKSKITRPPFVVYHKWDEERRTADLEVGIPVNSDLEGEDNIKRKSLETVEALQVDFYGPYTLTGKAHLAIDEYAEVNGIDLMGISLEIFVTDPSEEADTNKWLTQVVYPLKN